MTQESSSGGDSEVSGSAATSPSEMPEDDSSEKSDSTALSSFAAGPDPMFQILMLVGFIAIFYFLLWRPQQKRAKEHRNLIDNLAKGDEVATSGGMMGRIIKVADDVVTMEIADGVQVLVQKPAVAMLLPKGTLKDSKA